eukprot:scaffold45290_cov214-Amphora_coffeaeformis.AAC.1
MGGQDGKSPVSLAHILHAARRRMVPSHNPNHDTMSSFQRLWGGGTVASPSARGLLVFTTRLEQRVLSAHQKGKIKFKYSYLFPRLLGEKQRTEQSVRHFNLNSWQIFVILLQSPQSQKGKRKKRGFQNVLNGHEAGEK